MAEYQMTPMDRQRIARDTMAFRFDPNGARYEFRAGQHADFVFGSGSDNSRTFSIATVAEEGRQNVHGDQEAHFNLDASTAQIAA